MAYTDVVKGARNGRYDENGNIHAEVQFSGRDDWLAYMVTTHETSEDGKALFAAFENGQFGEVAPWVETPEMLAEAKEEKYAEINAWRDTMENGNYPFTLNGHRWDCGKVSQTRLAPVVAVAKSGSLPPGFFWTDADNIDVPMTEVELVALESAMQQNMVLVGFKIHERQRQMKQDVGEMTDRRKVKCYRPGWTKEEPGVN
ncbi:TPA: DUF4376 domain-containing protein [Salmonella enterica]|uniref:DUF4376 domain-containing protein n=1 Tax=Salmonella enterica TaxID=28901 RepID=UPI002908EAEE|nr:DUF4376 domain-containing protein [Salmonella enterica]HEB0795928.1 DUF4376 domain-containing protein [Salmonella enterica]HEB0806436.1 DUF4376 domain-containing protein [Salmonella enterica]HEB0810735.1 DUF4376 domain-containing protein [Salmonella enterica]HEB0815310.1 DUF4376 domain-containing protein [Salmonella enterica]